MFLLALAFTIGIRGLSGAVADDSSWLHSATGLIGPTVSGTFLWIIGVLNLLVLISIVGIFRGMRHGHYTEAELEHQLNNRGFMNRFYKRATNAVTKPWQMYPVGLLFGLGFDTATEVALLATAGAAAARGLPIYAILCLPILFAAYAIVALFVLTWVVALVIWHVGKVEEKWTAGMAPTQPASTSR